MINNDNSNPKPNNTNWQWPTNFTLTFFNDGKRQRLIYRENQNVQEAVDQWMKELKEEVDLIENQPRTLEFWAWHPFGRGFGAGVINKIFSRSVEMPFRDDCKMLTDEIQNYLHPRRVPQFVGHIKLI